MGVSRWVQDGLFTVGVTAASRYFLWRDQRNGRLREARSASDARSVVERRTLRCGRATLDAVYVRPASGEALAGVLLCHGIGEVVDHWLPVQHLLAGQGIGSMVFDYEGYGRSQGAVRSRACEANALTAFAELQRLLSGRPLSLLGFSLGTGVACAVLPRVGVRALVLCAAFTSFADAVRRLRLPLGFAPPIWDNEAALRRCTVPVLLMHGERDSLFPVAMARRLEEAGGPTSRLIVWPGLEHDDAYVRPRGAYWQAVAEAVLE